MPSERDRLLGRLAGRLREDTSFFASVLHAYQVEERLSEKELAAHLGISPGVLTRLSMCRRPASGSPDFASQMRQIGEYVGADPSTLAAMVRHVEAMEALRGARAIGKEVTHGLMPGHARGFVAAARDRTAADQGEEPEEDQDKPEQDSQDVDRQRDA